jgi:hypothetical protein
MKTRGLGCLEVVLTQDVIFLTLESIDEFGLFFEVLYLLTTFFVAFEGTLALGSSKKQGMLSFFE